MLPGRAETFQGVLNSFNRLVREFARKVIERLGQL